MQHLSEDLIRLFNQLFLFSENTELIAGGKSPFICLAAPTIRIIGLFLAMIILPALYMKFLIGALQEQNGVSKWIMVIGIILMAVP